MRLDISAMISNNPRNFFTIAFCTIVLPLQRLQIRNVITTTFGVWNNMVYFPTIFRLLAIIVETNKSITIIKTPNTFVLTWNFFSFCPHK